MVPCRMWKYRKISGIVTSDLIYFNSCNKGKHFCSPFANVGSYFVRDSQLYGLTVYTSVLTHHTMIALLSHRSLENSKLYSFSYSALFSIKVALMFTSMELK